MGLIGYVVIVGLLCFYQSLRSRAYATTSALPTPDESPWQLLWSRGDDPSFVSLTGFNRETFEELHEDIFERDVDDEEIRGVGRPQKLNSIAKLGLILHFLNSSMKLKTLCQLFGASSVLCQKISTLCFVLS